MPAADIVDDAEAPVPDLPDYDTIAETRLRAEQETAHIRAETEARRRAAENEEKARVEEDARRRSSMEAELARVEAELNGAAPDESVKGEQLSSEATLRSFPPLIAAVVRGVLPLLDAFNRRFKLKWDGKLATLRKRL
jgi:hypothetical protein